MKIPLLLSFGLLFTRIASIIIERVFDIDGKMINKTLSSDSVMVTTHSGKMPHDLFHIPRGFFFFNHFYVVADDQERIIEPASGLSVMRYKASSFVNNPWVSSYKKIANISVSGNVLYIRMSCHYWHFHYETIAQLYLYATGHVFERYRGQENYILLTHKCDQELYNEILEFYNFRKRIDEFGTLITQATVGQGIKTGNLIISTNYAAAGTLPTAETVWFIHNTSREYLSKRDHFRPSSRNDLTYFHRRIYVNREDNFKRRIINILDVMAILQKYDIFLYSPSENASYAKQVYIFSRAELVIGPSGTGFSTNIAFCNPQSTILIELFPYFRHTQTGVIIARTLNFKHYHEFRHAYDGDSNTLDFKVNTTELDNLLFSVLAT